MQYQQQTQAMTAKKEEALVKAIGELSKHIKEREMELTTRTRTTEKLKQLFSEKRQIASQDQDYQGKWTMYFH